MSSKVNVPISLRCLGIGKDRRIVLSSLCFVVITFFYFFVIGSALQPKIYTFQHRVTYENIFAMNLITLNIDTVIIISATLAWLYFSIRTTYIKAATTIFISVFLIPLFLGDYVLQSRVLYNIPFQIPAAISLYGIRKENHKIIFMAILLLTGYLSLHILANLGYVPPISGKLLIE